MVPETVSLEPTAGLNFHLLLLKNTLFRHNQQKDNIHKILQLFLFLQGSENKNQRLDFHIVF